MPLSDLFGFGRVTPADASPGEKEGMLARRKKELEDAMRASEGSGTGRGGGEAKANDDTYEDLFGKRHKKGSRD